MTQLLPIDDFWQAHGPILDVRSPGEYAQGHLPDAVSFPLFSDDERAQVGTCYKQQGKEIAIELGLELVGPKMAGLVKQAKVLAPERQVRVHCWRGGMRSGSVGWLLETGGLEVKLLAGGYKSFRQWVRSTLATHRQVVVVGGIEWWMSRAWGRGGWKWGVSWGNGDMWVWSRRVGKWVGARKVANRENLFSIIIYIITIIFIVLIIIIIIIVNFSSLLLLLSLLSSSPSSSAIPSSSSSSSSSS